MISKQFFLLNIGLGLFVASYSTRANAQDQGVQNPTELNVQPPIVKSVPTTAPVQNEQKPAVQPNSPVVKQAPAQVSKITYLREPTIIINQRLNLIFIDSGISADPKSLNRLVANSGYPNKAIPKGLYDIAFSQKGAHHFTGWGNPELFARNITVLSKVVNGQSKPLEWYQKTGVMAPTIHTQPQRCPGLQTYLRTHKVWHGNYTSTLKSLAPLRTSDPAKYNTLISEYLKKNPEPKENCPQDPIEASGVSNGCFRAGRYDALFIVETVAFHRNQGKRMKVYVDERPPYLPKEFNLPPF